MFKNRLLRLENNPDVIVDLAIENAERDAAAPKHHIVKFPDLEVAAECLFSPFGRPNSDRWCSSAQYHPGPPSRRTAAAASS